MVSDGATAAPGDGDDLLEAEEKDPERSGSWFCMCVFVICFFLRPFLCQTRLP